MSISYTATNLGLPAGLNAANLLYVSADGSKACGTGNLTAGGALTLVYWSSLGGIVDLGLPPNDGANAPTFPRPVGVSNDGTIVAGRATYAGVDRQWTWTSGGTGFALQALPAGKSRTYPVAMSANGGLVCGMLTASGSGTHSGYVWTSGGGFVDAGALAGDNYLQLNCLSGDGSVCFGFGSTNMAKYVVGTATLTDLGTMPSTDWLDQVGCSYDGTRACGVYADLATDNLHPYSWTSGAGLVSIGILSGSTDVQLAGVTSGAVYGKATVSGVDKSWSWTPGGGLVEFTDSGNWFSKVSGDGSAILSGTGGVWVGADFATSGITTANAISYDGTVVVGQYSGSGGRSVRNATVATRILFRSPF